MGLAKMSLAKHDSTSYFGAFVAIFSSLTLSDLGVLAGILFGLATLLLNWYYKAREDKRAEMALRYQIKLKEAQDEQEH